MGVLLIGVWKWKWWIAIPVVLLFLIVDGAYFAANLTKVPDGGWFPLLVGAIAFTLLTTWAQGPQADARAHERRRPAAGYLRQVRARAAPRACRARRSSWTRAAAGMPSALLHNIKHNKVLHERVVVLTVQIADVPYVDEEDRCEYRGSGRRLLPRDPALRLHGGNRRAQLRSSEREMCGGPFDMMKTSFFLSRARRCCRAEKPGMTVWREKLFAWMMRNAATPMEFFRLPTNRVVELGSQVEI